MRCVFATLGALCLVIGALLIVRGELVGGSALLIMSGWSARSTVEP